MEEGDAVHLPVVAEDIGVEQQPIGGTGTGQSSGHKGLKGLLRARGVHGPQKVKGQEPKGLLGVMVKGCVA